MEKDEFYEATKQLRYLKETHPIGEKLCCMDAYYKKRGFDGTIIGYNLAPHPGPIKWFPSVVVEVTNPNYIEVDGESVYFMVAKTPFTNHYYVTHKCDEGGRIIMAVWNETSHRYDEDRVPVDHLDANEVQPILPENPLPATLPIQTESKMINRERFKAMIRTQQERWLLKKQEAKPSELTEGELAIEILKLHKWLQDTVTGVEVDDIKLQCNVEEYQNKSDFSKWRLTVFGGTQHLMTIFQFNTGNFLLTYGVGNGNYMDSDLEKLTGNIAFILSSLFKNEHGLLKFRGD
jgi:hypothetical protein